MRRTLSLTCVLFLFFCIDGEAIAALSFLPASGLVLDDKGEQDITNDQFWIADLSLLTNMTYEEQINEIQSWNEISSPFYNEQLTPWHMATETEMQALSTYSNEDIIDAFLPSATGYSVIWYSGRYDKLIPNSNPSTHELHRLFEGEPDLRDIPWSEWFEDDDTKYTYTGAWITASYSATTVPIPASFYLLLCSLIGLVGFKLKFKKVL